ncbi:hypothetical protein DMB65_21350 [Flavobacterium cheongpyeongense]|uniref:Uncharacterized protein n=1 Tax=Flavobacterium cheongpyeongense TaxID=2212651 RepID=A0A2V4BL79_9FLAO|nr:hypothetical protein [Flavobacterium cheongpyeongense]PXY38763.1 hypothetical protein DMB65_21350 [Flavobacterium cheongpyeongense]
MIKHKDLKKVIFIGISCCLIASIYYFFFSARVQIEVYNKSDFDIDSLKIDDKFYKIPKQKSLVINCRKLTIQGNLPFGAPNGIIKNMQRDTITGILCGTDVEEIRSGKYKFDIKAFIGKDYYMLNWAEHK